MRTGTDPKLFLEGIHKVIFLDPETSHIRHFHGFTLTMEADIMAHIEMVLRLVTSEARLVTFFEIAQRLLLAELADPLLMLRVQ